MANFKTWITKSGCKITTVLSGRTNVFLLSNGEKNILVDTSISLFWKKLDKRLHELNVHHIDYLIITHTHFDHVANTKKIKDKYKAIVIVHQYEAEYLASGKNIIPGGTNLYTCTIVKLFGRLFGYMVQHEPCRGDIIIDSTYDLNKLGFNANIIHTPGHSSGSVSIIIDDEIALVGDAMLSIFKQSVLPPFADNVIQLIGSWGKLLKTNCSIFIPSHGKECSRALLEKDYHKRIIQ